MKNKPKPKQILLSKRANVFYLEHARILQKDGRIIYLVDTGEDVEQYFNIPDRNTAFVLLGKGTSITDAAMRCMAASNVIVGFCGSGGSPLFASAEPVFMAPQSEYRPTEYMQAWAQRWFNEPDRIAMAKRLLQQRINWTELFWEKNKPFLSKPIPFPRLPAKGFEKEVAENNTSQALLLAEAQWARKLYATLARHYALQFKREEGKGSESSQADRVNSFLDHGNYIAYGYAAVVLHGLGISFSFPLLHGKTRRGALVFDIADLIKDGIVMPLAFECGCNPKVKGNEFRARLIELCQEHHVLDQLFTFVKRLAVESI